MPRRGQGDGRRRRRDLMPLGGLIDVADREGADREGHRQGREGDRGAREEARQRRTSSRARPRRSVAEQRSRVSPRSRPQPQGRLSSTDAADPGDPASRGDARRAHDAVDAGTVARARAALLVVDIQERLMPAMPEPVLEQRRRATRAILIEAAHRLGLPIVVSQQYPKGLGPTVAPIEDALRRRRRVHRFDKVEFSAADAPRSPRSPPRLGRAISGSCAAWRRTSACTRPCAGSSRAATRCTSSPTRCAAARRRTGGSASSSSSARARS